VTNSLAFYSTELITALKSFIVQAPVVMLSDNYMRKGYRELASPASSSAGVIK